MDRPFLNRSWINMTSTVTDYFGVTTGIANSTTAQAPSPGGEGWDEVEEGGVR